MTLLNEKCTNLIFILQKKRKTFWYACVLVTVLGLVVLVMRNPGYILPSIPKERFQQTPNAYPGRKESLLKNKKNSLMLQKRWFINRRTMGILIPSAAILFVSSIYFNVKNKKRKDGELLQLKNQSLEAEKKLLKSQITPHFLFNTLKNLYSLATVKSNKTADAIQQLSKILRYSI